AGPVEVAFDDGVRADGPGAAAFLFEGDVEIGEDVEAEGVGGANGGALLGPAAAGGAFDVDVPGGGGVEAVLVEFEVVDHRGRQGYPAGAAGRHLTGAGHLAA